MSLIEKIEKKLYSFLAIETLMIDDNTPNHANHELNDLKGNPHTHLAITVKSKDFDNIDMLDRHKKIYSILKDEVAELHAISIKTLDSTGK